MAICSATAAPAWPSLPALTGAVLEAAATATGLRRVIAIEPPKAAMPAHVTINDWAGALAQGGRQSGDPAAGSRAIARDALACLIYTSGTGGAPKGVMLSHRAILHNCVGAYRLLLELGLGDEVFLSFLPLSHAYEHSCGLMFPVSIGAQVYFAEGVESLSSNLVEVRPTIMTSVPRLYEVMRQRILLGVQRAGGLKARLFQRAVALGRQHYEQPLSLSPLDHVLNRVLDRLVRAKVRARFGGRLKAMVSGGAPLDYEVGLFFTALGLRLLQGYGQTEAAPVVSCNPPSRVRLETVGPPLADVELRIAEDGEILVRGPLLMDGYWNQPEITAQTLKHGWLHTGDIGVIDDGGFLRITDRKKDIIVLSGGDNVAPQRVEGRLCLEPEIGQAYVAGDRRPHLVALVVPSDAFIDQWAIANRQPADLAILSADDRVHDAIGQAIKRVNRTLSVIEQVKRFTIADAPFTVANGMMTPTMKIRRHTIRDHYRERLEGLY